jgi:cytoskeletal protein CcmA (bactofilin family)
MAEDNVTVIDAQTEVEGKLRGKDALIRGRFQGEIEVSGRLVLGEGSRVEASIKADAAEISGERKGDVRARNLILAEKARVQGTVDAKVQVVREGAWLNGSVVAGEADKAVKAPTAGAPGPGKPALPGPAGDAGKPGEVQGG